MKTIKSVMLIDDSRIIMLNNQIVVESLESVEHIHSYHNAKDALNYLKLIDDINIHSPLFTPQLILLDLHMPDMDGFTFLHEFDKLEIFKQNPIRIFLVSSSTNPDDIYNANNNKNISGLISKPLTIEKLTAQLNITGYV